MKTPDPFMPGVPKREHLYFIDFLESGATNDNIDNYLLKYIELPTKYQK